MPRKPHIKQTAKKSAPIETAKSAPKATRVSRADLKPVRKRGVKKPVNVTYDVTTIDAIILIESPPSEVNNHLGGRKHFKVETQPADAQFMPGKRIAYVLVPSDEPDGKASWRGFAFVDEFGVKVWHRLANTVCRKYANMLECPNHYTSLGCKYNFTKIK